MKRCGYCGKESPPDAVECWDCGVQFPPPPPPAPLAPPPAQLPTCRCVNLDEVAGAKIPAEGFTDLDWPRVRRHLETAVPGEDRDAAWREVVLQWADALRQDLGGAYRLTAAGDVLLVAELDPDPARTMVRYVGRLAVHLRSLLGEVAWGGLPATHLVLLISEEDDYYAYISRYYPEGEHARSIGVSVNAGYPHVAVLYHHEEEARRVLTHEECHQAVAHLPLPVWLNEGLAQAVERELTAIAHPYEAARPFLDRPLAARHQAWWTPERLQAFWAGRTFDEPGDGAELSYSLAEVLFEMLRGEGSDLCGFVRNARPEDAGQSAALDVLGVDLGDAVASFLGPGAWRPSRPAIARLWAGPDGTADPATTS